MMASMLGNLFGQQLDPTANLRNQMQTLAQSLNGKPEVVIPAMIQRMNIPPQLLKQYGAQATETLKRMGIK